MIKVEIKGVHAYKLAIERIVATTRKELPDVMRSEAKLLLKLVVNFTPFETLSEGQRTVTKQLGYAVAMIPPSKWKVKSIRKYINRGDFPKAKETFDLLKERGLLAEWAGSELVEHFDPQMHEGQRNARGRVRKKGNPRYVTSDAETYRAYVATLKGRVGYAKAGWGEAMKALGITPAAWVARHKQGGQFVDMLETMGTLLMTNPTHWAAYGERVVINAMTVRANKINRRMSAAMQDIINGRKPLPA